MKDYGIACGDDFKNVPKALLNHSSFIINHSPLCAA